MTRQAALFLAVVIGFGAGLLVGGPAPMPPDGLELRLYTHYLDASNWTRWTVPAWVVPYVGCEAVGAGHCPGAEESRPPVRVREAPEPSRPQRPRWITPLLNTLAPVASAQETGSLDISDGQNMLTLENPTWTWTNESAIRFSSAPNTILVVDAMDASGIPPAIHITAAMPDHVKLCIEPTAGVPEDCVSVGWLKGVLRR